MFFPCSLLQTSKLYQSIRKQAHIFVETRPTSRIFPTIFNFWWQQNPMPENVAFIKTIFGIRCDIDRIVLVGFRLFNADYGREMAYSTSKTLL